MYAGGLCKDTLYMLLALLYFTNKKDRSLIQIGFFFVIKKRIFAEVGFQRLNLRVYGYRFFNLNTMVMNLVLAIIPVLLLIILMAFFKMSGDKVV